MVLVVSKIDTIQINKNDFRRRIYFKQLPWLVWMEGVGNLLGLLFYSGPLPTNGMFSYLICFKQNDTIIYFNDKFDKCISEITNVSENEKNNKNFIIYPNPVDNQSVLEFSPIFQYLELFNSKGILLKKIDVHGKDQYSINKECFIKGLYFFKLTTLKNEYITGKFIVN